MGTRASLLSVDFRLRRHPFWDVDPGRSKPYNRWRRRERTNSIVGLGAVFMQWKTAPIVNLFCSLAIGVAATGCRPIPPPNDLPASPHQGAHLRIACPDAESESLLRRPLQSWALRQNATLEILRYDAANESAPSADVWILVPAELPRWAAGDQLTPLPERYRSRDNPLVWSDLLPALREQLLLWEAKPYGLPFIGEAPICCYRRD